MERFTYHIHPHKTITNVIRGKGIRKPMALKLTKEEVMKCIACGPVYRAFPEGAPIRVTGRNLDDLHVSWEEYLSKLDKKTNSNIVVEPAKDKEEPVPVPIEPGPVIIEPEKEEEPIPVPVEPGPVIIEEEKEEEAIVFPLEPGPVITETVEETVEEENTDDVSDDTEFDEEDDEEEESEPLVDSNGQLVPQQNTYHRKKKKRH